MRLLLVEDERELADALALGLRQTGFAVDIAYDGMEGEFKAGINPYDLVILDVNLPGMDGLEVCRRLRSSGARVPVLMLTARTAVSDRVQGLNLGADDYMSKPFAFEELTARIHALIRRSAGAPQPVRQIGALRVDPVSRRATWGEALMNLTSREFDLLEYLTRAYPAVVSAEELLERVWDEHADPFSNAVRVHLGNLRRKLREQAEHPLIETVIGKGYRLCVPETGALPSKPE